MGRGQDINWVPILLGMPYKTNREIADEYGIRIKSVSRKRREMGIPNVSKWDRYKHLLGVEPDAEVAKKVGVTAGAVTVKRSRDGIPPPLVHSKEAELQKDFVKTLDGFDEYVSTDYGEIDILTDEYIYECKYELMLGDLHRAIGQLILYSEAYPSRHKVIVTSRVLVNDKVLAVVERLGISLVVVSNLVEYDIQRD